MSSSALSQRKPPSNRICIKYPKARQLSKEVVPFIIPQKWLSDFQKECSQLSNSGLPKINENESDRQTRPIATELIKMLRDLSPNVIPFNVPDEIFSSKRRRVSLSNSVMQPTIVSKIVSSISGIRNKTKLLCGKRPSACKKKSDQVPYDGPPYKYIEQNVYTTVPSPSVNPDEDLPFCDCKSNQRHCSDDECINRVLMVCCPPSCPAAPHCQNMFPINDGPIEQFKTENRGWGLRATKMIPANHFVTEYRGEIINSAERERRQRGNLQSGIWDTYLLGLESDLYIDARFMSGLGRFLNHSCEPNTIAQKWQDGPHRRIAVIAKRDIQAGEEITLDYSFSNPRNQFRHLCLCGSKNCRGYIDSDKPVDWEAERKRKLLAYDYCFECGEGGELLTCNFSHRDFNCHRAFHAACLGLNFAPPPGTWFMCPSHICDICKKIPPQIQCLSCVSTWCPRHSPFPLDTQQDNLSRSRQSPIIYRICPRCVMDDSHFYFCSSFWRPLIERLPQSRTGTGEQQAFDLDSIDNINLYFEDI